MKTVRVKAVNLKIGDIYNGQRIKAIHKYPKRIRPRTQNGVKVISIPTRPNTIYGIPKLAGIGVLVIAPNPDGYKLDTFNFRGDKFVKIKRPKYNMNSRGK